MSKGAEGYVLHSRYGSIEDLRRAFGGKDFRLDLGCGYAKPAGFIGIDNLSGRWTQIPVEENAPDIVMDLDDGRLPFDDGSVEEVRSSHFLEHARIGHVLRESHRVLRPGGIFLFAVPYANSAEGMYPGHSQFLTEKWFHENLEFRSLFEIDREEYFPSSYWLAQPKWLRRIVPFDFARTFFFNACSQMMFWCHAKK